MYGKKITILDNISLNIKSGQRIGLLGKNGSGKSSILKAIIGSYPNSGGKIQIQGKILSIIETGLGINEILSGRDNIYLTFLYNKAFREYTKEIEREIISFSEIKNKQIDMPLKTYSSGMKARLSFAATIFQKGDILLMDEVFATKDQGFIEKSYKIIEKKWSEIDIGIIVSHNIKDVQKLCDYCYIVDQGKIIDSGSTSKMIDVYYKRTTEK